MKKLITAVSLVIAVGGLTNIAVAEDCQPDETEAIWSPTGTIVLSTVPGFPLSVTKGISLSCDASGSVDLDGSNASVASIGLSGNPLCVNIAFTNFPYNMEGDATNDTVTLENVDVQGVTGNCLGDLTGDFDQATGEITFNAASIPSNPPGGSDCIFTGFFTTSPQASFLH